MLAKNIRSFSLVIILSALMLALGGSVACAQSAFSRTSDVFGPSFGFCCCCCPFVIVVFVVIIVIGLIANLFYPGSYHHHATVIDTTGKTAPTYCPQCGAVVDDRYDYCHKCGAKIRP